MKGFHAAPEDSASRLPRATGGANDVGELVERWRSGQARRGTSIPKFCFSSLITKEKRKSKREKKRKSCVTGAHGPFCKGGP